jgi:hypothetical protein
VGPPTAGSEVSGRESGAAGEDVSGIVEHPTEVEEGVEHSRVQVVIDRCPGVLEPHMQGLAVIAERIEPGGGDEDRGKTRQIGLEVIDIGRGGIGRRRRSAPW